MADPATLRQLADEVERLTGPSREHDALVWIALERNVWATVQANPGKSYRDLAPDYTTDRARTACALRAIAAEMEAKDGG